jgi:thymidylate kinase
MKKDCKIIAFEGIDSIGKATQSIKLTHYLNRGTKRAVRIEFPLESRHIKSARLTYRLIRQMLKSGSAKQWPYTFQALQFINKLVFQLFWLKKLTKKYDYIVLDRWAASMWAYGRASGVDKDIICAMLKLINQPDITIVLTGKSFPKENVDSYEADTSFQQHVDSFYKTWHECKEFGKCLDWISINANDEINAVHTNVCTHVDRHLYKKIDWEI